MKKAFESLGFANVRTILASGKVLFETSSTSASDLRQQIEAKLEEIFGHQIGVILHSMDEIHALFDSNPFGGIEITPQTRLYVTFLSEKSRSSIKGPFETPEKDFKIVFVSDSAVCSVLTLSPNRGTTEGMSILEKEFGKKVTTRNWNTITRILKS